MPTAKKTVNKTAPKTAKTAPKAEANNAASYTPSIGDIVIFNGYDESAGEVPTKIFAKGDIIKILKPGKDQGAFSAAKVDDEAVQDTVLFPEEFNALAPATVSEEPAKEKAAKKAPKQVEQVHTEEEEEPAQKPLVDTAAVKKLLKSQSALDAAKHLVEAAEQNYFNLGGVLKHIQREETYLEIKDGKKSLYDGPGGFDAYVEEELGLKRRKAYYLMDIYERGASIGLDAAKIAELSVGWSKSKELVKISDTVEDFERHAKFANKHTSVEVADYVKKEIIKLGGKSTSGRAVRETVTKTAYKFSLFEDQAKFIDKALEAAGKQIDSEDRSAQFAHIVTDWVSTSGATKIPLKKAVAHLEQTYGVKLSVEKGEK